MQQYNRQDPGALKEGRGTKLLKRLFALTVLAAIAGAVIYASVMPTEERQMGGRRARMMAGTGPVPVLVAPARVADFPLYLNGVGTAKARNTVTVRPQVDGRIVSINFKEGQDVKRGDILAKIDPATYQAQLDQASAKKALDEAQLANARRDLERYAKLGGNVIAQKTIDTQRALVEQLSAQIKLDDAAIANAQAFLDYTVIRSPIDGRTGIRMVDEGNLVRASDAGIVMITELKPITVLFTLPQQALRQVNNAQANSPIGVEALGADGQSIDRGKLQVVDNQVDQSTGTVRMKAELPNTDLQLWPGQFVNVRLLVETLNDVVVIPTPAIQRGPNGTFVYVVEGDGDAHVARQRPVSVSHQTEEASVVAGGVTGTDRVVTSGFARLKDGAPLEIATPEQAQVAAAQRTVPPAAKGNRANLRAACASDVQRLCSTVEPGRELRTCLRTNRAKLSDSCKAAIAAGRAEKGGERKMGASSTE